MTDLILTADRLFDGETLQPYPVLHLRGARIESVSSQPAVSATARRLDFPGCTILPGLIDTHVHLVFSALDTNAAIIAQVTGETDEQLLDRAARNARAALAAGITTVRDCGGRGTVIQALRDRIRRGECAGPTVLSCGAPITTTRGHCHWLGLIADTPPEVTAAAEKMLGEGVDFLKVMATGGNMTPTSDPMTAQYDEGCLRAIADIGRRAGKHAAAHVLSRSALPAVVAAKYRTIEHCDWRVEEWRYEFDADLARRIRDQGQYVGLTMSGTARRALVPEIRALADGPIRRLDARFACERQMIEAGLRYTLHSDAGVRWTPIETFALGLRCAAIELRLTPTEVLRAVTSTAADAIEQPDRGRLAKGKYADLLIVEGNPLADLAALEAVRCVVKEGTWVRGAP
jgi:imidazolonepropionase-like amidohydrolase